MVIVVCPRYLRFNFYCDHIIKGKNNNIVFDPLNKYLLPTNKEATGLQHKNYNNEEKKHKSSTDDV